MESRLEVKFLGNIQALIREENAKLVSGLKEDIEYLHKNVEELKNDIVGDKAENVLLKKPGPYHRAGSRRTKDKKDSNIFQRKNSGLCSKNN